MKYIELLRCWHSGWIVDAELISGQQISRHQAHVSQRSRSCCSQCNRNERADAPRQHPGSVAVDLAALTWSA